MIKMRHHHQQQQGIVLLVCKHTCTYHQTLPFRGISIFIIISIIKQEQQKQEQ
jgi:hypothetical protein